MLARLIIWLLLVFVPFQSFAAVGLIQCEAPEAQEKHVHLVSSDLKAVDAGLTSSPASHHHHDDDAEPRHSAVISGDVHGFGHDAHHAHKLSCCSDGAIIFSSLVSFAFEGERFGIAFPPETNALISVFLEGPKRPPRTSLRQLS